MGTNDSISWYTQEVLGRHVVVEFAVGKGSKPYLGTIREMKAVLLDNGNIETEHLVVFDDGDQLWFDLVAQEQMDALTWINLRNNKSAPNKKTRRNDSEGDDEVDKERTPTPTPAASASAPVNKNNSLAPTKPIKTKPPPKKPIQRKLASKKPSPAKPAAATKKESPAAKKNPATSTKTKNVPVLKSESAEATPTTTPVAIPAAATPAPKNVTPTPGHRKRNLRQQLRVPNRYKPESATSTKKKAPPAPTPQKRKATNPIQTDDKLSNSKQPKAPSNKKRKTTEKRKVNVIPYPPTSTITPLNLDVYDIDADDRIDNATLPDRWIQDMDYWISHVPHGPRSTLPTSKDARIIMNRIKQLAAGEGLNCQGCPDDARFYRGIKIDLSMDLETMLKEAKQHAKQYGSSMPWVVKYFCSPLRRLIYFRNYYNQGKPSGSPSSLVAS